MRDPSLHAPPNLFDRLLVGLTGWLLASWCVTCAAADLRVLTAGAFKPVLLAIQPQFEQQTGHRLLIQNDTAGGLQKRVLDGEAFDVVISSPASLKAMREAGKSFDHSAPIGAIHPVSQIGHFTQGSIWLKVNGNLKQNADLNQMIWSVAEQISKLSEAFELFPGDIIYSGTPSNVGPVVVGDVIEMHIDKLPNLSIRIS